LIAPAVALAAGIAGQLSVARPGLSPAAAAAPGLALDNSSTCHTSQDESKENQFRTVRALQQAVLSCQHKNMMHWKCDEQDLQQ